MYANWPGVIPWSMNIQYYKPAGSSSVRQALHKRNRKRKTGNCKIHLFCIIELIEIAIQGFCWKGFGRWETWKRPLSSSFKNAIKWHGCWGHCSGQDQPVVICLRSAQLVWFLLELQGKLPACRGTASDPARAPHGFFPTFVSSFISSFEGSFKGSGKQPCLFATSFSGKGRLPSAAESLSLGMPNAGREWLLSVES